MGLTETVVREAELDLVVRAATLAADDILLLDLAAPDGAALPEWTPGAHIDLVLTDAMVRQYSLCGDPADRTTWRVAVLLEPSGRGGSRHVHGHVTTGSAVRVRGPRNHFGLVAAPAYRFVAGGIGITPILPMIRAAQAAGADWHLTYVGRARARMAFVAELATYAERVDIIARDIAPRPDLATLLAPRPGTLVYCCGPEPLLAAVEQACADWTPGALHLERFAAAEIDTSTDVAFSVVFERSGVEAVVGVGESVFTVARAHDVPVLGSCLEGICGTCETDVISGEVDHRDAVLTDAEKQASETMMICVSRCCGAHLVLDL